MEVAAETFLGLMAFWAISAVGVLFFVCRHLTGRLAGASGKTAPAHGR